MKVILQNLTKTFPGRGRKEPTEVIAVNDFNFEIPDGKLIGLLGPGGRLCVITFHSLEDRIVKTVFKRNENPCTCPPGFPVCVCGQKSRGSVVTKKPILPSAEELAENNRSKSAKLRVFQKEREV